MSSTSASLYVNEQCIFGVRREGKPPEPAEGEILVQTHFSGANPADTKHPPHLGIYPAVLGYDFCGEVVKAPPGSSFSPGEMIAGYTPTGTGRPIKYGTHQSYLICPENMAFRVPPNMPPHHAACMTVVAMTAADALYNLFKFPLPHSPTKEQTPILIWGASSSVGVCTVQLARASGIGPIFVTASPSQHALLTDLGASHCFDYQSPTVISDIKSALQDTKCGPFLFGIETVGTRESAKLLAECTSPDTVLASVVLRKDPRFKMPFASTQQDVTIQLPNVPGPVTIPGRPEDSQRAWKALYWAVENYGAGFRMPAVEIFEGTTEQALDEVKLLGGGGRGFGKLVLRHPLL